jgi:hypothetical protein
MEDRKKEVQIFLKYRALILETKFFFFAPLSLSFSRISRRKLFNQAPPFRFLKNGVSLPKKKIEWKKKILA